MNLFPFRLESEADPSPVIYLAVFDSVCNTCSWLLSHFDISWVRFSSFLCQEAGFKQKSKPWTSSAASYFGEQNCPQSCLCIWISWGKRRAWKTAQYCPRLTDVTDAAGPGVSAVGSHCSVQMLLAEVPRTGHTFSYLLAPQSPSMPLCFYSLYSHSWQNVQRKHAKGRADLDIG